MVKLLIQPYYMVKLEHIPNQSYHPLDTPANFDLWDFWHRKLVTSSPAYDNVAWHLKYKPYYMVKLLLIRYYMVKLLQDCGVPVPSGRVTAWLDDGRLRGAVPPI